MLYQIVIEKMISGGRGLGRLPDGMVVMVDHVLPGETVKVRITGHHKGYREGRAEQIVSPSPGRINPPCQLHGLCGGCDLQHAAYELQLEIKKQIVHDCLERILGRGTGEPLAHPMASPRETGYRSRIRLQLGRDGRPGFFQPRSHRLVPVKQCLLVSPAMNRALAGLHHGDLACISAACREIELLESPLDGNLFCVLSLHGKADISPASIRKTISPLIPGQVFLYRKKKIQPISANMDSSVLQQRLHLDSGAPCTLSWSVECFSQVNPKQNQQLVREVCRLAGEARSGSLLDLYCGIGNFSIPLGMQGTRVTGIEHNLSSIAWAKKNRDAAGLDQVRFLAVDTTCGLRDLIRNKERFNCIVLDPPRQGIGKDISLLPELEPEKIIYVSCDPATLARDLRFLTGDGRFKLTRVLPVDMFPQTHHIESVAVLEKN
ncbi:class I SAM-dependent RNA methyltransferase [Desulfolithobacter sp.]